MSDIVIGLPNYMEDEQSRYIEANVGGLVFSSIYLPNGNPINSEKFDYKILWAASSAVLLWALWYGWYTYSGDISYGRLNKIPFAEVQWYRALAPGVLLLLTRLGVPVSTSFLVLSAFASTFVLEKMLMKSMMGYAVAAVAAYVIWIVVSKILDEAKPVKEEHKKYWRIGQWFTTGFLWWTWLSHDMANICLLYTSDAADE